METNKKSNFGSAIGFVLSAAGSAVGLGNLWRFPYLAAENGGGLFLCIYIVLAFTFGFALLTTDIAIGRRTGQQPTRAYATMSKGWGFLGKLTFLVPAIIMTYYTVIGGWILKYMLVYITGQGAAAAQDGYFVDFIEAPVAPVVLMLIFLAITAFIVYAGVDKGIERFSKIVMPGLLLLTIGIAVFGLTLSFTDANGVTRTGLQGFMVYITPSLEGVTFSKFMSILLDAMSQLFYSLSVSMGIMITYGSYVKKDVDLNKSITQIELFDTGVAFLAGMMIVPAVYVFSGMEGMTQGTGLMFVLLPKVFEAMGAVGPVIGLLFFVMTAFAALTSSVSIMETLVASCMDTFHAPRKKTSLIIGVLAAVGALIVCLGYNVLYFRITLPNGTAAQILDVADYLSTLILMPIIALLTCIVIGWVKGPDWIAEEMEVGGHPFRRKKLYAVMIKYIAPVVLAALLLSAVGIL